MAEIGVYLENMAVIARKCPGKPTEISSAKTVLAWAVQHMDARIFARACISQPPGAIRRVVINDQKIRLWEGSAYRLDEGNQVVTFGVGRDKDQGLGHGRLTSSYIAEGSGC